MSNRPYRTLSGPRHHGSCALCPAAAFREPESATCNCTCATSTSERLTQPQLDAIGAQYCDICKVYVCSAHNGGARHKKRCRERHSATEVVQVRTPHASDAVAPAPGRREQGEKHTLCLPLPLQPGRWMEPRFLAVSLSGRWRSTCARICHSTASATRQQMTLQRSWLRSRTKKTCLSPSTWTCRLAPSQLLGARHVQLTRQLTSPWQVWLTREPAPVAVQLHHL